MLLSLYLPCLHGLCYDQKVANSVVAAQPSDGPHQLPRSTRGAARPAAPPRLARLGVPHCQPTSSPVLSPQETLRARPAH